MSDSELKDYLGIPRKAIPWYPVIDRELCTDCELCVNSCKHGTYAFAGDPEHVVVANPYHCEVFCESCKFQCPVDAITFPDRQGFKAVIKGLRAQYPPAV